MDSYGRGLRAYNTAHGRIIAEWLQYLQSKDLEEYLRVYGFYLDMRRAPKDGERLPEIC
jgi:hypothetical protein